MKCLRVGFDTFSGYKPGKMNETTYLRRFIFLETVAGVPGMNDWRNDQTYEGVKSYAA